MMSYIKYFEVGKNHGDFDTPVFWYNRSQITGDLTPTGIITVQMEASTIPVPRSIRKKLRCTV